ncbi:MAG: hypothetical protein HYR56_21275 [Acidobacteria bacterium]|nr:hypothetical protein [Acidobacteriota bacterium]MBI3421582.1 hypothetical protein [Acidobacteriota bacterium]
MKQIEEVLKHLAEVVEKPHPAFGDLPVCPFAYKARVDGRIKFVVQELDERVLVCARWFMTQQEFEILVIIHPTRDGISLQRLAELAKLVNDELPECGAFTAHPEHDLCIGGVYTRREPYPSIQFIARAHARQASDMLKKTRYYELWTEENLKEVGVSVARH